MFKDLGHEQVGATEVLENYQRVIALVINVGYNARTNQIDIRHHFIRENVERGTITIKYVDTKNQLADILTKSLGTKAFKFLRDGNGISNKVTVP